MKVKDLMIPVSDCPQVSEARTIYDAIVMLEASRERFRQTGYLPRVLLVRNEALRVIGSLRHADMLRAFAGGADEGGGPKPSSDSWEARMTACRRSFGNLLSTARRVKVKAVMHLPSDMEYVAEDAPIEEAACRLTAGPHLHLFVRSGEEITGILRMSDLFLRLCEEMKKPGLD